MYKLLTRRYGEQARFRHFKTRRRTRQEMREKGELLGKYGGKYGATNVLVEEVVEREAHSGPGREAKEASDRRPREVPPASREPP